MRTTTRNIAVGVALTLLGPSPAPGQGVVARAQACESGVTMGSLGISGLDCVGECSVTLAKDGREESWVFSTEPRIFSIEAGGPSDGTLKAGDRLVAIDGMLITTREGGRRYADVEPGETVTVRYRRDGVVQEVGIRVGSRCAYPPAPTVSAGRVAPPPPPRPVGEATVGIATAPRVRVLPEPAVPEPPAVVGSTGILSRGAFLDPTPRGRLGIGLQCEHCGTQTDEETGQNVWFFSGPIEVTQVNSGGPAEKAGIQMGDLITAIDGHDIATEAGGLAFSNLMPGEPVQVTVVRRNGREEEVTVVPTETEAGILRGRLAPPPAPDEVRPPRPSAGVAVAPPPAPSRAEIPEPAAGVAGPEELPLTYSGTVAGVEVVVRGGPVAVSELRGARILIINAEGLWVRIRVPAGTGGGEGGR
ncbi:MAG: PDZ domain-containing protein [Longimicrobiales bacterium]